LHCFFSIVRLFAAKVIKKDQIDKMYVSIWLIPCEVSVVIRQKNDDFFAVPAKSSGFPVDSCGFLMISRYFSLHF